MDEKHRKYCIQLGNPYMGDDYIKPDIRTQQVNSPWMENDSIKQEDWFKNNKKFTN